VLLLPLLQGTQEATDGVIANLLAVTGANLDGIAEVEADVDAGHCISSAASEKLPK
jgi:hypothetical protein